jgi:hypothetical protein
MQNSYCDHRNFDSVNQMGFSASTYKDFPCSKEILVLARNLQGNKIYKEMARKYTKIKGNCKDFCNLYQLQVLNQ